MVVPNVLLSPVFTSRHSGSWYYMCNSLDQNVGGVRRWMWY